MRSCVRICSGLVLAVAAVAVHPPPAWAQSAPATHPAQTAQSLAEPNTLTLTPFLSTAFGTSQDLGGSLGLGVAVGYHLSRNIRVMGGLGPLFDAPGNDTNQDGCLTKSKHKGLYLLHASPIIPISTL